MKRVAIYVRVSTEEQVVHWNGIQIQKDALLNYVKLQGFHLEDKHIFIDEWRSWAEKINKNLISINILAAIVCMFFYVLAIK